MSSSKQLSGCEKRKRKAARDEESKKMKGFLYNFLEKSEIEEKKLKNKSGIDEQSTLYHSTENSKNVLTENEMDKLSTSDHPIADVSEDENIMYKPSSSIQDDSTEISVSKETNANYESENFSYPSDVGLWPDYFSDAFREYFTLNKPEQNIQYIACSRTVIRNKERVLTETSFYRRKKNNELIKREWLVYSRAKNAVFCYMCKLFSDSEQALCKGGFSYWKNTSERLKEHENSIVHRNSVLALSQRLTSSMRIDSKFIEEYSSKRSYWRKVLTRVVATIQLLCQKGLAFFGNDETLGSVHNGNFLGVIELLSKFDPFLAEHLAKYGNPGSGKVNYLSSTIVTELINIMSEKVLHAVVTEVQTAKYFGLIVDSTPDITHNDQLSVVLRYVDKTGKPVERFVKFLNIYNHDSHSLCTVITSFLDSVGIDIINCRGQSYDNASNMAGKYSGLQARIKKISNTAEYIPCSAHSLNLVGVAAVDSCEQAISFFGLMQTIYNFFSSSTHRWAILSEKLSDKLTVKSLSVTRWSAAAEATKSLRKGYKDIIQTLELISISCNETNSTRHESMTLQKKMHKLETAILTVVWDSILQQLNKVNKTLQSSDGDISVLIPLYDSLIKFIQSIRDDFDTYEHEALQLVNCNYTEKRKKKIVKNRFLDDSNVAEVKLTSREQFITQCHYVICDLLMCELNKRKSAYLVIENRFSFLMHNKDQETVRKSAKYFQSIYNADVDEEFEGEMLHFVQFLSEKEQLTPKEKLQMIRSLHIDHTFSNVDTALQILLTMPISNCSSERSFSSLKRIKNNLRNCIGQDQLSCLSILSIESDMTMELDFQDVIDIFASKKARKMPL